MPTCDPASRNGTISGLTFLAETSIPELLDSVPELYQGRLNQAEISIERQYRARAECMGLAPSESENHRGTVFSLFLPADGIKTSDVRAT